MASLLETLGTLATPENVGAIAKVLGVDASLVQQGLKVVGPTLLGSLAKTSSTPEGLASLTKLMPTDLGSGSDADILGSVLKSVTGGGTGADMMQNVLGEGANAISGTLSKSLGFDVGPLLKLGIPLIMGLLAKTAKTQNLDAAGVANMLQAESKAFMADPANKAVADLVQTTLKAGDEAADLRKRYTDAEWKKVRGGPLAAMYLVATASPSKGADAVAELAAAAGAVAESLKSASPTSLIGTAFGGGLTKAEVDLLQREAPPTDRILGMIREGVAAVKAKSPGDAAAYTSMVMNVAQKTAEAAKEGGFLGIGGTRVTKEEQAALDAIRAALS
ncbi:MAG: DUF937 domain-containing protein [Anaerolineae bacterium]|nr:DUF937 domain-containing protein [Candidatus Roseilinea sp.]MDW8449884.1 DUF937 domain-containing protein [Anaerolineae bacterium]